jgi:hypothetical protein
MAAGAQGFGDAEQFARASGQLLAGLVNLGRHTITGALSTAGLQQQDWSASYRRLQRLPVAPMFTAIRQQTRDCQGAGAPWIVAVDDSIVRKSGRRIPACGWRRDPLSPAFAVNFIWGQRVLQCSAAIPHADGSARLVPVDFRQAPLPRKPGRGADALQQGAYREACKQANLNRVTAQVLAELTQEAGPRSVHFVVDGRFTNKTLLRRLPAGAVLIGRIRKDSVVYARPDAPNARGRPRRYGTVLPTPEALRVDDTRPWQSVRAWAVDGPHEFRIKTLGPVRSRLTGVKRDVRVVVIAPVGYRLRRGSKLLYRKPAYLLCTDPALSVETLLQEYLWRWEIEVNFRDEKTLLGVGEAQVRHPRSVDAQPAASVAAYAWLLLAAHHAFPHPPLPGLVPLPKWRRRHPPRRPSTAALINHLRAELWAHALKPEILSHFRSASPLDQNRNLITRSLASAVFYAHN